MTPAGEDEGVPGSEIGGKPTDWIVGIVLTFGPPSLMLWALATYPLLDGNDPAFLHVSLVSFGACVLFCSFRREILFPWGNARRGLMWGTIVALGAIAAMVGVGGFVALNGMLDSAPARPVTATVVEKDADEGDYELEVESATLPGGDVTRIDVSREQYERAAPGDALHVRVGPGFLGHPWVASYRLEPR